MSARDDYPYRERNVPMYIGDRFVHEAMCDEIDRLRAVIKKRSTAMTIICAGSGLPGVQQVSLSERTIPACSVCGRGFSTQGRKARARTGNAWLAIPPHRRIRPTSNHEAPSPILTRHVDGRITINWCTPDNRMPTEPVGVLPDFIVSMVEQNNALALSLHFDAEPNKEMPS